MVDLSEAGGRLAAYRPADPTRLEDIHRRSQQRRRRRRRGTIAAGVTVAAAAVAAAIIIIATLPGRSRPEQVTTTPGPTTPATAGQATAQQLASGHWSVVPQAPIPVRDNPVVIWTGQQIIVWGGQSGPHEDTVHSDGAAYSPSSRRWTVLPPAPISGRSDPAAVWTGTEMVIWGGYDNLSALPALHVAATGAAFDPATDTWRSLPASPLSARAGASAVWTGTAMLILGGSPAVQSLSGSYRDGALYTPATNSWTLVPGPGAPDGHGIHWVYAAQAGTQIFAWSTWSASTSVSADETTTSSGVDLYRYDLAQGTWHQIAQTDPPVAVPWQAVSTPEGLLVRGAAYYCGPCQGPFRPEATALYDPTTNRWAAMAPDPIAADDPQSAWTGAAVASVDLTSASGTLAGLIQPGDATAYDPQSRQWARLPTPPHICPVFTPPIWTGTQLLDLCSAVGTGQATTGAGETLTPAPAPAGPQRSTPTTTTR